MGYQYQIRDKASASASLNQIRGHELNRILQQHGVHELDSSKVVRYLEINSMVDLSRLEQVFTRARTVLASKSRALENLDKAF